MTDVEVERIQVIDIQPEDTIVVTLPEHAGPEAFQQVSDMMKGRFDGHDVLVVTAAIDIAAMRLTGGD